MILRTSLAVLLVGSYFFTPREFGCTIGATSAVIHDYLNLSAILEEWKRQCDSPIVNCRFDTDEARRHMRPRFSTSVELGQISTRFHWNRRLIGYAAAIFAPSLVAVLLGLTFRGRVRRAILLASAATAIVCLSGCFFSNRLAEFRFPGTYAFLNDFEFLEPPFPRRVDWNPPFELVAYVRATNQRRSRTVAESSGKTSQFDDDTLETTLTRVNSESSPIIGRGMNRP
jgi:hypothetical protein